MFSNKLTTWLIIGLVIVLAVLMTNYWATHSTSQAADQSVIVATEWEGLARHLTAVGVVEYGAWWCNHCKAQEQMFGDAWQYVTSVESSTPDGRGQTETAKAADIRAYPTWIFPDGSRVEGVMTYAQLAEKSGYNEIDPVSATQN